MNIFATDRCPVLSALALDDIRVNKMIIESAQMLSTNLRFFGVEDDQLYKSSYFNHPCTRWARHSRSNFLWLVDHALSLCVIYSSVYHKTHACQKIILLCLQYRNKVPEGDLTEFADCTEFKDFNLPVTEKYRLFMNLKWNDRDKRTPTWRKRTIPDWRENVRRG